MDLSKSQVDRLGERLRTGEVSDEDIQLLDAYRRSFSVPYAAVFSTLRDRLSLLPTGRPAKSTQSIIDKLRRESVRLSQIQDIAGCRVVVPDIPAQNSTTRAVSNAFGNVAVVDRRTRPSHGYRAVHVLVAVEGRQVEVQVRTTLQQRWAELSEKLSDALGIAVKYGGGDQEVHSLLMTASTSIAQFEAIDVSDFKLSWPATFPGVPHFDFDLLPAARAAREQVRSQLRATLEEATSELSSIIQAYDALPD